MLVLESKIAKFHTLKAKRFTLRLRRPELCLSLPVQDLQVYCDFSDVIDISIKQGTKDGSVENRIVSINRQDSQTLVRYTHTALWSVLTSAGVWSVCLCLSTGAGVSFSERGAVLRVFDRRLLQTHYRHASLPV